MHPTLRGARAAVLFLTTVPVGGGPRLTAEDWRWSAAWFSLVGSALGLGLAGVWVLVRPLGSLPAAALVVAAAALATGALHEDGLADTADALGGVADRDRVLAILKDSRIGAYGAVAVALSVTLRIVLLAELEAQAVWALIVSHGLARTAPVWLVWALPYVTPSGAAKGRRFTETTWRQVVVVTLWPALVLGLLVALGRLTLGAALAAVASVVMVGVVCGTLFARRVGGVTGDFLGAAEQASECAALVALAAARAGS